MTITAQMVKELRAMTGAGPLDCKNALAQFDGDMTKAADFLREKGLAKAAKKAGRATNEGIVHAYIHHNGKVGVLVEVDCETDFVARNEQFQAFLNDLCLHICAAAPLAVTREEVPADLVETERRIAREQMEGQNKPPEILEKIVEGKLRKWYSQNVLLEQPFVKDDSRTVQDVLNELITKTGENIVIKRFARFVVGETDAE